MNATAKGQEGHAPQVQAEGVQTVQEQSPQTRPEGVRLVYYITSWAASPPLRLTSCVDFHPSAAALDQEGEEQRFSITLF